MSKIYQKICVKNLCKKYFIKFVLKIYVKYLCKNISKNLCQKYFIKIFHKNIS